MIFFVEMKYLFYVEMKYLFFVEMKYFNRVYKQILLTRDQTSPKF